MNVLPFLGMFRDTNDDIVSLQESFNVVPFITFGSLYL